MITNDWFGVRRGSPCLVGMRLQHHVAETKEGDNYERGADQDGPRAGVLLVIMDGIFGQQSLQNLYLVNDELYLN